MPFVKFEHKSYGQMTTVPEYWVAYELFDAVDEAGDTMPVYKSDCDNPKYIEE
ncbi:MAG: hypothetical protein WC858_01525 [Parcubacteria group bacterium]|jgi:hypothetical protein